MWSATSSASVANFRGSIPPACRNRRTSQLREPGSAFLNSDPPAELAGQTEHVWYRATDSYRLNLPEGELLTIESNLLDSWDIRLSNSSRSRLLAQADTLTRAAAIADTFVMTERPDAVNIVKRLADWRSGPPSEKQMEVLANNRIPIPKRLTKGQASQIISQLFASRMNKPSSE